MSKMITWNEQPDDAPENVDLIITHDFNDIAVATRKGETWDSFGWKQRKPIAWILMPERDKKITNPHIQYD